MMVVIFQSYHSMHATVLLWEESTNLISRNEQCHHQYIFCNFVATYQFSCGPVPVHCTGDKCSRPVVLTFFTYLTLSSNNNARFTPIHSMVLIHLKYEKTNSYSLELFVKFIFAAIDGSVNLPLWKMKFTPRGKFTQS